MKQIKHRTELVQILPVNPACAEIGVAEGYFSAEMLSWGGSVIMVDMWETNKLYPGDAGSDQNWHNKNYQDAKNRVAKYGDKATILRGPSIAMAQHVADGSLDLLYLDACHSYQCVLADLQEWFPKVKSGGIIAGHDYLNGAYGVFQAVQEFTRGRFTVITIPENKDEDAGFYFVKA